MDEREEPPAGPGKGESRDEDHGSGARRPQLPLTGSPRWWRDVATLVGVLGLLVTLVFNTIAVRGQLDQARRDADRAVETRRYTEIGVLTQLASEARASDRVIESGRLLDLRCDTDFTFSKLKRRDEAALRQALGVYDYMAWLFNEGDIALSTARRLWGPRVIDAADLGSKLLSKREVEDRWPELWRFAAHAEPSLRPAPRCAIAPPG